MTDDVDRLVQLQQCAEAWDTSRKRLVAAGVAALAKTDGAIVATADPDIVAFGVVFNEFAPGQPHLAECGPGVDPFVGGTDLDFADIGGSRHRSAARFCSTFAPASAIVASHDGGLTAFIARSQGDVRRLRIPKVHR